MASQLGQLPKIKEQFDTKIIASNYSCQILLENTTLKEANKKDFPTDAYLISYVFDGKVVMDLTRCSKQADLFDFYYDKYGNVQNIRLGFGTRNPKTWGLEKSKQKKSRK